MWKNGSQKNNDEVWVTIHTKDECGLEQVTSGGRAKYRIYFEHRANKTHGRAGCGRHQDASKDLGFSLSAQLRVSELSLPCYLNTLLVNIHMAHSFSSPGSPAQSHSIKEAFSDHHL